MKQSRQLFLHLFYICDDFLHSSLIKIQCLGYIVKNANIIYEKEFIYDDLTDQII